MKYTYAYRTSDGRRLEAVIEASSRDAVFAELRKQGIRPIKVIAADGSRENGEGGGRLDAKSAKGATIAGVGVLVLALSFAVFAFFAAKEKADKEKSPAFEAERTRRQVIGDTAIIDKGIATGWADVFEGEGERFFASFAIPGVKAGQRNTTVEELETALKRRIDATPDDGMESRQIKAMVEGMKAEARAYIADGGTIQGYGRRLTERQDAEIAIYESTKADVAKARETMPQKEFLAFWEERNDKLRNLGIKLIPLE